MMNNNAKYEGNEIEQITIGEVEINAKRFAIITIAVRPLR